MKDLIKYFLQVRGCVKTLVSGGLENCGHKQTGWLESHELAFRNPKEPTCRLDYENIWIW